MRLIFDSVEVVIFRILTGQAGSNWWLGENLILTFRSFDLIRQLVRRSGSIVRQRQSSIRLVFEDNHKYKSGTRKKLKTLAKVVEVVTS
jgi:hypothetical protein